MRQYWVCSDELRHWAVDKTKIDKAKEKKMLKKTCSAILAVMFWFFEHSQMLPEYPSSTNRGNGIE